MRQALLSLVRRAAGVPRVEQRIDSLERRIDELQAAIGRLPDDVLDAAWLVARDHTDREVRLLRSETLARIADADQAVLEAGERRTAEHAEALRVHAQRHAEELSGQVESRLNAKFVTMQQRLDALRHRAPSDVPPATVDATASAAMPADLYLMLEERFRGDPAIIAERQKQYLPYVAPVLNDSHLALDLGPGRGEWLSLLKAEGHRAVGVDSNEVFVERAREAGLDVIEGDLVAFLARAEPDRYGAITLFQVLEHLPFAIGVEVMRQALRALAPGGVLLIETPNSENLRVGSSTFWLDPTHVRPYHPELLRFLADEVGFASSEVLFLNRLGPTFDVSLDDRIEREVARLVDVVDGAGDVTLVAWKGS